MKKLIIIPLLFLSLLLSAIPDSLFVSTTGSDGNAGTFASPWATLQKGFDEAGPGDTVFFMGGTYYQTTGAIIDPSGWYGTAHGNSGTSFNIPVTFMNYPGEVPIIDCSLQCDGYTGYNYAIAIYRAEYVVFKGLTIRNVFMCDSNQVSGAITAIESVNLKFENMTVHNVGQRGYWINPGAWTASDGAGSPFDSDSTYFINCDTYTLCDTISETPGNAADGWKVHTYENNYYSWYGCRVWDFSDNGIDVSGQGIRVVDHCWEMPLNNFEDIMGVEAGGGGIKLGACNPIYLEGDGTEHFITIKYSLSIDGSFLDLDYDPYRTTNGLWYNNTAFTFKSGFTNNQVNGQEETSVYRNNLVYGTTVLSATNEPYYVAINDKVDHNYSESNNFWDASDAAYPWFVVTDSVTVTDDDFVSVDSATIANAFLASRNADGSLPAFPLQLAVGSDLIDAGIQIPAWDNTDIVLTFNGVAPDIGAFEYGVASVDSSKKYITAYSFPEQTGVAVIDTAAKTVDIEVEYGTDVTGLIATFSLSTGAEADISDVAQVSGTTENDFTSPVTYTVTALDASEQEWTITVTVESDPVPTVATVGTTSADYTSITANVTGRIYSANGGTLTARGICYNTTGSPTTSDRHTTYLPYVGSFTDVIRGLRGNTTYYFRAYGTTSEGGTSYGDAITVTTLSSSVPTKTGKVLTHNGYIILAK